VPRSALVEQGCDRTRVVPEGPYEIKRHIAGQHEMTMILNLDIGHFRPQADSWQDIESSGAADHTFRHHPIVRKQQRRTMR
jgi:hypothetical protein